MYLLPMHNHLIVVSKTRLRQILVGRQGKDIATYPIPGYENGKVVCTNETCWIGGLIGRQGKLTSVHLQNGTTVDIGKYPLTEVYDLVLLDRSNRLATAHANGEIVLWDLTSGKQQKVFGGRDIEIYALAALESAGKLYSGNAEGVLDTWDINSGRKIASTRNEGSSIFSILYNPFKRVLLSAGGNGILYVRREANLALQMQINLGNGAIFSCDNGLDALVICGLTGGKIAVINIETSKFDIKRLHKGDVTYVKANEEGTIVTASKDGVIKLWKASTLNP